VYPQYWARAWGRADAVTVGSLSRVGDPPYNPDGPFRVVLGSGPVKRLLFGAALAAMVAGAGALVNAHFRLVLPASWLVEDMRGDPQKYAPCGGTVGDPGTPTGAVTELQGGQMLRVVVEETIFHPGHYRIALARTRTQLPRDPQILTHETDRGIRSVSAVIAEEPQPPVLVDGLWPHTERPAPARWVTDVQIPNIECEGCVMQIIQFMADHPGVAEGGFSYHHCATVNITADSSQPIDDRW
jgi:hypothetical protein